MNCAYVVGKSEKTPHAKMIIPSRISLSCRVLHPLPAIVVVFGWWEVRERILIAKKMLCDSSSRLAYAQDN